MGTALFWLAIGAVITYLVMRRQRGAASTVTRRITEPAPQPASPPTANIASTAPTSSEPAPPARRVPEPAEMFAAVERNDGSQIRTLVREGANSNVKDEQGMTPLHHAVFKGANDAVEGLLIARADVDLADDSGATPLEYAARCNNALATRLLLAVGADPNQGSPLVTAASRGSEGVVVELLTREGLDKNQRDKQGWTAIHRAAEADHQYIAELLRVTGADDSLRTPEGWLASECAERCQGGGGEPQTAASNPEIPAGAPSNPATVVRSPRDFSALIASPNQRDAEGNTPLHHAAAAGDRELVAVLLLAGVETAAKNNEGMTPLMVAAARNQCSVSHLLIDAGSLSDADPALLVAAAHGSTEFVRLLLYPSGYRSYEDEHGSTALHYAAAHGHRAVAETLLRVGADPGGSDGECPDDIAREAGHEELADYLAEQIMLAPGERGQTPESQLSQALFSAIADGNQAHLQELLAQGADVSAHGDTNGLAPLHLAVRRSNLDALEALLLAGAEANTWNASGAAPLSIAAAKGDVVAGRMLLAAGADPNADDAIGSAAFAGHRDVLEALLEAGADPNQRNKTGWTPLHSAATEGHTAIIDILLLYGADPDATTLREGLTVAKCLGVAREEGRT